MNVNSFSRREFIATLGLSAAAAQSWTWTAGAAPSPAAATRPAQLWIDPKLAALPPRPWRKIHQDFHNTQHIGKIGAKFNTDEYGDRLLAGNVDAIVVFAKDMHGFFYLPLKGASARALVSGGKVRARTARGGVEFTLPRVLINEVVCLELAG